MSQSWWIFLTVFALVLASSFTWVFRSFAPRKFHQHRRRVILSGFVFAAAVMLIERMARATAPVGGGLWRVPLGTLRGAVLCLVGTALVLGVRDLVIAIVVRIAERFRRRDRARDALPHVADGGLNEHRTETLSRREAFERISNWSVAIAGGSIAAWGAFRVLHDIELVEHEVYVPGLPSALEGLTIVHLTDLHVGIFTGAAELSVIIERSNALRGDLLALTGDLLDNDPAHVPDAMRAFSQLKARLGRYAVLGNHDYFTGYRTVIDGLRSVEITTLDNESVWIPGSNKDHGLALLGLDELTAVRVGRGPDLPRALGSVVRDGPKVMLSHNPKTFLTTAGHVDVQLSGHTHGGQINPWGMFDTLVPFLSGHHTRKGSQLFVSNGLGITGPPVRIGRRPQILRLGLTGRSRTNA